MSDPVIEVGDVWDDSAGCEFEVIEETIHGRYRVKSKNTQRTYTAAKTSYLFTHGTKISSRATIKLPPGLSLNPWSIIPGPNPWGQAIVRNGYQPLACEHTWIDTGMRRTYCKHCDARAELDVMNNTIRLIG